MSSSCRNEHRHPSLSIGIEKYPEAQDLYEFAETLREKHDLPALGIGIARDGKIIGLGMAGERITGSGDWATLDDRFDVASCAKPVTATIAAMLVEKGVIRWDTTLAESFPEMRRTRAVYHDVTLDMLLRHRSGLDRWMSTNERWANWQRDHAGSNATEQRRLFVEEVLQHQARYRPGDDEYYCNDGYLVAGSMLERAAGKSWEELVTDTLFKPLGLDSMRYGGSTPVWGHESRSFGRTRAIEPNPNEFGEPPFGSPGGFLYCTVPDLLGFVNVHIQGETVANELLGQDSFSQLHTQLRTQHFALGWEIETKIDESGKVLERSIYHGGFSGRFRSNIWFSPESRTGTVIVYNHGGDDKADAYADIFYTLLREFRLLDIEK